jgi:predicted MFS family arabinose efflux permease
LNRPQLQASSPGSAKVVTCLFCILFLGVADNQTISPLLPALRAQLGKSSHEMGYLFTGYSLCAGLSVLGWGPLSDLFGRKRGLIAGLWIFGVGSVMSGLSSSFASLMIGRIITGAGASMLSLNTLSYAADFFPYEVRGSAMGSIFSSYFAALIFGVPLGSWIGDRLGWNAVFGLSAASALVLLFVTRLSLPAMPSAGGGERLSGAFWAGRFRIFVGFLRASRTCGGLLSAFFASAGTTGFLAFLGVWLHDAFGIPGKQVGLVFLASGLAALIASPAAGRLSDWIGKRIQFILSNLTLALFLVVLPDLRWGPALFAACGAISLAAAFRQGPMEALLTEVVRPELRGSFVALKNSFSQLGIALAALASGILFERVGYVGVCLLCAVSNVAAAGIVLLLVRERHL